MKNFARAYESPQSGRPASRDELIERGIVVVRRTAFRMIRRLTPNVDVEDLVAAGTEGLLRAVDRWDPSRGPFEPYIEPCVRGAILDELRASDAMTRHGRKRLREVTAAIGRLEQRLGRAPEGAEVAQTLGITIEEYWSLMADFASTPVLGSEEDAEGECALPETRDPVTMLEERDLREALRGAILRLPDRTQKILALYYQEECTLAEIGKIFGVSESRVCQLLGEAVSRLRVGLEQEVS